MNTAGNLCVALTLIVAAAAAAPSATPEHPSAPGFLVSMKAYVLTVQYKDQPPTSYNVPIDKFGWGDVCTMREASGGRSGGFSVSGADGVRLAIKRAAADQYEVEFHARVLFRSASVAQGPTVPGGGLPAPDSLQAHADWTGTLTIGPGQTATLPLGSTDWKVAIMRVASPVALTPGVVAKDTCWSS